MSTLETNIAFARKHWQAYGGVPWEIASGDDGGEPDWLYSELWLPLHSFRVWPVDKDSLCMSCRGLAGELTQDYYSTEPTRAPTHLAEHKCRGLTSEPIQFIFLDLPRQWGKTSGTSGYAASLLFNGHNESITFMAGSDDQVGDLCSDHYKKPIAANRALDKRAVVTGNLIRVPARKSELEVIPTSLAGATGGSKTLLIIDECRIVPPDVFIALVPTIFAQNGWKCPSGGRGHSRSKGDLEDPDHATECSVCGDRLVPWVGKCLAMSSAGEIKDGKDWFQETIENLTASPDANSWVYSVRGGEQGKRVAKSTVNAVTRIFGGVSSLAAHVDIETENIPRRRGEGWLTKAEIDATMSKSLTQKMSSDRPCVAFLDTSRTGHLTSFVVLADDSEPGVEDAWSRLVVERIDIWTPSEMPHGIIDDKVIEAHLDQWVPCFPLVSIRVDTRAMAWAVALVKRCKKSKPYRGIIDGVFWRDAERNASWSQYERHILGKTIKQPANERLRSELRGARRVENADGVVSVRETRGKTKHLDVAESVAACVYMAHLQTMRKSTSLVEVESAVRINKALRRRGPRGGSRGGGEFSY